MSGARPRTDQLGPRARRVLDASGHVTLATVDATGFPWSAPVHYVWFGRPPRLLFASMLDAQHSRNIAGSQQISGSLVTSRGIQRGSESDVDGAQFTGWCTPVPGGEIAHWHAEFFQRLFPDPDARAMWMLPVDHFSAPERHRLYMIWVARWWFPDLANWVRDRVDRRFEVALDDIDAALG